MTLRGQFVSTGSAKTFTIDPIQVQMTSYNGHWGNSSLFRTTATDLGIYTRAVWSTTANVQCPCSTHSFWKKKGFGLQRMAGKKGGTGKPSDILKKKDKDYDEVIRLPLGWQSDACEEKRRREKNEGDEGQAGGKKKMIFINIHKKCYFINIIALWPWNIWGQARRIWVVDSKWAVR